MLRFFGFFAVFATALLTAAAMATPAKAAGVPLIPVSYVSPNRADVDSIKGGNHNCPHCDLAGADLTNTLVIDGDTLMNAPLQRYKDEFVRHKILDAVGDLKLAGLPIIARFEGRKSSHSLNNQLLRALFADPANYRIGPA